MPAASTETPRDTLKDKKEALAKAEEAAQKATDAVTSLRSEVAELTRAVNEVDQVLAAYDKTLDRIKAQSGDLAVQIAGFDAVLQSLVKEKRAEIDAAIKAYDDETTAAQTHVNDLRSAWEKARDYAETARQEESTADDRLKRAKDYLRTADTSLSELTALVKQIQQAMTAKNYAGAFFLLTEAQKIKIEVRDHAAQEKELLEATSASEQANAKTAAATKAATQARNAWQAAIPDAEKRVTNRRVAVVEALKAIVIPPPKAPSATALAPAAPLPPSSPGPAAPGRP